MAVLKLSYFVEMSNGPWLGFKGRNLLRDESYFPFVQRESIAVMLLVAYANADIASLLEKFNSTITSKCTPDSTTTAVVTSANTATTTRATNTAASITTTAAPTPTTAASTTTTAAPTATTVEPTTTTMASGRKKRAASQFCVAEESKVAASTNVTEFHTNLQAFSVCQKTSCPSLASAVNDLLNESGATAVKVCWILVGLMFVILHLG